MSQQNPNDGKPQQKKRKRITNTTFKPKSKTEKTENNDTNQDTLEILNVEVEISKFMPIYTDQFENNDDSCSICGYNLNDVCDECHELNRTDCGMSMGLCGHKFHTHCIQHWLNRNRNCPMEGCNLLWVEK